MPSLTNKIKHKPSGLVENYFLTVAWRILWDDLYRLNSRSDYFAKDIFDCFCAELGDYLLSIGNNNDNYPPKKFKTYVYKLDSLIKDKAINELAKGTLFGYSFFHTRSNSISVIVYAGLVFVTYYNYDKRKYMIIGQKPIIFKSLARRKEMIDELKTRFCEMASQYKKVMTPELQQTIQEYYKKHDD